MRFGIYTAKNEKGTTIIFKIWDSKLGCFYRQNGHELGYKTRGKCKRMLDICNKNWPM